ncbi:hypothetical protein [Methylocella sp.]|uniref:hypothetical protein n=1 Tax=Methylocella sp. TaxID=1978226 RepID=UPI003C1BB70C
MHRMMSITAAVTLMASAALSGAQAGPAPYLDLQGVEASESALAIEKAQYYWGGQNYCWYPNGWRGPGWYWCGYAFTYGYGWGGGYGWRGWGVPGYPAWRGGGWHGGYPGWHGGGGVYHGGVYRGGVYRGGGFHGGYHGGGFHGGGRR